MLFIRIKQKQNKKKKNSKNPILVSIVFAEEDSFIW